MIDSLQYKKASVLDALRGYSPSLLHFRDKQSIAISNFLSHHFIRQKRSRYRLLLVCGPPGVGKTFTVSKVLQKCFLPQIHLNCLTHSTFAKIITALYSSLFLKNKNKNKDQQEQTKMLRNEDKDESVYLLKRIKSQKCFQTASSLFENEKIFFNSQNEINTKRFNRKNSLQQQLRYLRKYEKKCVVYLEEMQQLLSQCHRPEALDFFKLFGDQGLFILIGVSNCFRLLPCLQKYLQTKLFHAQPLFFSPYSEEQCVSLLQEALKDIQIKSRININITPPLLRFLVHKMQLIRRGDLRAILEALRKTIQIAQIVSYAKKEQFQDEETFIEISATTIQKMLNQAEGMDSVTLSFLSFSKQLTLLAVMNCNKNEVFPTANRLICEAKWICDSLGIQSPRIIDQLADLVCEGFLKQNKKEGMNAGIQNCFDFNFNSDSLLRSLKQHPVFSKVVTD